MAVEARIRGQTRKTLHLFLHQTVQRSLRPSVSRHTIKKCYEIGTFLTLV